MKHFYFLFLTFLISAASWGQINITGTTYSENFDGMGDAGTTLPSGWSAIRIAGTGTIGADLVMAVTNGSANSGNIYNVGTASASDRALGTLGSGSTSPAFGARFLNNTGSTITKIDFAGVMEQWRSASNNTVNEVVAFSYSFDATKLNDGNWTPLTNMDLVEKLTTTTSAAAVDGNLSDNKTSISGSINSINWLHGTEMWIRWVDADDFGSDGLYAIDDFTMTFTIATAGIGEDNIPGFKLYPNPVKGGKVFISSANNYAERTVQVFDVLGKQVVNQKGTQNSVDVSHLNKGIYIMKVAEEGKVATRKLVIE